MKAQALGWLAAAVVAAGLNATYHQGGMEWAHRIADRVGYNTEAVIALATGHADRFLAEAQVVKADDEVASCRFSAALARVQSGIARSQARFERLNDRFDDAMTAREAEQQARSEAQAARMEARRARLEARMARIRIPAVDISPVVVRVPKADVCPRIRVNVPRMPAIRVPEMPTIHIDVPGLGPV